MAKWFETAKKVAIPTLAAVLALGGYSYAANLNTAAASNNPATANVQTTEKSEVGSIFLGQDQDNDQGKDNEVNEANESKEDKALAVKAKISKEDAEKAAIASVPGAKVLESELGNENGYLIYEVNLKNNDQEIEVKVDAGNGTVLSTQSDAEEEHQDANSVENEDQGPDDDTLQVEE